MSTPVTSSAPRRRLFTPVNILALGAGLVAICWFAIRIDTGHRNMGTFAAIGLTYFLLVCWLAFASHVPTRQRMMFLLTILSPVMLLRIDGCQGDMVPKITWRWAHKPDYALSRKSDSKQPVTPTSTIDLNQTTSHDYPRFLGPDGTGHIKGVRLDPDWKAHPPRELWRRQVGAAWSGFSVVGNYAITQEQRGDEEAIVCYHLKTGEPAWVHTDPGRHDTVMGGIGPRATPTIDRGTVYTLGAERWLHALDGATGQPRWTHDLVKEFNAAIPDWGRSGSPLVVDQAVIVSIGGEGQGVAAFQCETGDLLWKAGNDQLSYAAPVLANFHGTPQIVMLGATSVTSHDPATGKVLWTFDWPGVAPKVAQPIVVNDHQLIVSSGYSYGSKLLEVSLKDNTQANAWQVAETWDSRQLNPKFTNPIIVGNYLYGLDDGVAMTCLDLQSGKRKWKNGRYGHGQMVLVDDLFLIQAEAGDVVLVEPNPKEHRELARIVALPTGHVWNNPTVAGRYLLVRNDSEAACYELSLRP